MNDLIKREDAIEAIEVVDWYHQNRNKDMVSGANSDEHQAWYKAEDVYKALKEVPSAEITHDDVMQYCNSRLLVLATVESIKHQYRIGFEDGKASADRPQGWIPCSERLPEDSGDYLVCPSDSVLEDYSDFSEVMIMPYDADCEAFGWWTERYDPISLGYLDSDFNEFEVLAWMPLPEPWKGADDEDN